MSLEIKTSGVYCRQYDMKDEGYLTIDENGTVKHHQYKAPSRLEKIRYLVKYGYEMNTQTICTDYIHFLESKINKVFTGVERTDAISLTSSRRSGPYGKRLLYSCQDENQILIEKPDGILIIKPFNDGENLEVTYKSKSSKQEHVNIYRFVDWTFL